MSGSEAVSPLKRFAQMLWHLVCVAMLTAFIGLASVRNDYYAGGSGSADLLTLPLAVGTILSILVVLAHVVRWRQRHRRADHCDS